MKEVGSPRRIREDNNNNKNDLNKEYIWMYSLFFWIWTGSRGRRGICEESH
jgi:hypothetical protein